jgi:tellurite resistance protein TerC
VFIGLKMSVSAWIHVNAALSLGVVVTLLGGSIVFSLMKTRGLEAEVAARPPGSPSEPADP